jgi:hypothetical protein
MIHISIAEFFFILGPFPPHTTTLTEIMTSTKLIQPHPERKNQAGAEIFKHLGWIEEHTYLQRLEISPDAGKISGGPGIRVTEEKNMCKASK